MGQPGNPGKKCVFMGGFSSLWRENGRVGKSGEWLAGIMCGVGVGGVCGCVCADVCVYDVTEGEKHQSE